MKKTVTAIAAVLLLIAGVMFAASPADGTDERIESICKACAGMKSMKCDFTQTRTVPLLEDKQVSKGHMLYFQPSRLKWSYTEPFPYSFSVDGETVSIDTESGHNEIGADGSRLYQGIAGIMLGCMSGECLRDSRLFKVTMTDGDGLWIATMDPLRRDMKKMFRRIELGFSSRTGLLEYIDMTETGGAGTHVTIENVQLNGNYETDW